MNTRHTWVREAADVTDEIIKIARDVYDGWFNGDDPIDWHDFLDRLDGAELEDGSKIDLSDNLLSPAIRKIKREILAYRKL